MMDSLKLLVDMALALFQVLSILWPIWLLAAIWGSVKLILKFYKAHRLSQSGIAELDNMDGLGFEKYLEGLFHKLGYRVNRTVYQGDYGADLIIQKVGIQTVVQAKRHHSTVGLKAVQEVVAAKNYYQAQKAMVITNGYYSQQAQKLAQANEVELWDRNNLVNVLLSIKQSPMRTEESTGISTLHNEVSGLMGYYVYENRQYAKALIHKGICGECNNGKGKTKDPNIRRKYSKWHGPFATLEAATEKAIATNQPDIRQCQKCL